MKSYWDNWLDEEVEWKMGEYIPRRRAIMRLARYGLIPFLTTHGYCMYDVKKVASGLARILYENAGYSCLESYIPSGIQDEYPEEHMHRYYHVVDEDSWSNFWLEWAAWSDLDRWDRRIDIQVYCWTQIDLEKSPQKQVVDEFLYFDEYAPRQDYLAEDPPS